MYAIPKTFRTGAMALILAAGLSAQTTSDASQQPAPAQGAPASTGTAANPGYGRQVPNDDATLSGGQPHTNSTYQKDRNGNLGLDLGWLGLLGLAGLLGLGRGRTNTVEQRDVRDAGVNRS